MTRFGAFFAGVGLLGLVAGCKVTTDTTVPDRVDGTTPPPTADGGSGAPMSEDAILAGSDLPPAQQKPLKDDPMGVTIHRLSNGMTVYISTDRQKPQFTAWIGVRAGSRMDPPNSTGLAHYLEHMLFKGTDEYGTLDAKSEAPHVERIKELYAQLRRTQDSGQRKKIFAEIDRHTQEIAKYAVPNEHSRMYSTLGIEGINAFTSFEQTVYIGTVPTNRLDQWAAVEGERFSDPVFRLFYPELEAVYEEKNLSIDNPYRRVYETMYLSLFPAHPYGTQTTIGSVDHLKNPAYQDMSDFFDRWYVPNNMAVVLAGDIDAKTALPVLTKAFGHLKPKQLEPPHKGKVIPIKGRTVRQVATEGEESVRVAWLTVPEGHPDEPALALMDRVFDDEKVGLLNVELELTQKVPSAGSGHSVMNEAGYFSVQARARQGQSLRSIEKLMLEVVAKLKKGGFSDADVEAAKLQWTVAQKQQREFPFVRASRMMDAFITHRSWEEVVARDRKFEAVTRDDIIRVAKKYLNKNFVVIKKIKGKPEIPKLEKPTITPVKIDPKRKSPFAKNIEGMKARVLKPEWVKEGVHYVHRKLPAGDLIASVNERNDLFSVQYGQKRGYRKEPLLCYALDLFDLSGVGSQSAEAVQKELYALGSSVSTSCDAEHATIHIEGLDSKMEQTLAIVDKWLADPTFNDKVTQRLLKNTLTRRKDHFEQDWALTSALDTFAKYDKRSAWLRQPSNAKLSKADAKKLQRLIKGFFGYEHRTLYFGPRKADAVTAILARGSKHRRTGGTLVRKYRRVKGPTVYFLHKDGAKANVRFTLPRKALPREQRPVARLLSEYLSGNMSALVFQEIRESRGLAYSAYSTFTWGNKPKDASGLLGFVSTQADKTPDALTTMLGLLQSDEIQPERLVTAKESVDQEFRATRIDPRWIGYSVSGWDDLGEKEDPRPWLWNSIKKLELEDTKKFAGQFVKTPAIISIVGDRERVDLEALRKVGQVQEVKPEQLFSYGKFVEPKKKPKPPKTFEGKFDKAAKRKARRDAKATGDKPAKKPKAAGDKPAKAAKKRPRDSKK